MQSIARFNADYRRSNISLSVLQYVILRLMINTDLHHNQPSTSLLLRHHLHPVHLV